MNKKNNKPFDLYDTNAETILLGALINKPSLIDEYDVKIDIFYHQEHKNILNAINYIRNTNNYKEISIETPAIDYGTLINTLKNKGLLETEDNPTGISRKYIQSLCLNISIGPSDIRKLKTVKHYAIRRNLLDFGNIIINNALDHEHYSNDDKNVTADDILEEDSFNYAKELDRIFHDGNSMELPNFQETLLKNIQRYDPETRKENNDVNGIDTGLPILNKFTNGIQRQDLTIIAAQTRIGKTAFALQLIHNVCDNDGVVAFFELEQTEQGILDRLVANKSGIGMYSIKRPSEVDDEEYACILDGHTKMEKYKLYGFYKPSISPSYVASKCYQIKAKEKKLDLVVVDHLHLMRADGIKSRENKNLIYGTITEDLKNLAKTLDVPVVCLSQLNRDSMKRDDKHPTLADIRDSGTIEQNSDLILGLYRADADDVDAPSITIMDLDILKNRHDDTTRIYLVFQKPVMRFHEASDEEIEMYKYRPPLDENDIPL